MKKTDNVRGDIVIVIFTIQKFFVILTGQPISEENVDKENENQFSFRIVLRWNLKVNKGDDLKVPPDYFSIYY